MSKPKKCDLVVLESRWWDDYNISVAGTIDLLSEVVYASRHKYHYEQFCNGAALAAIVPHVAKVRAPRMVYIAAHGEAGGLQGSVGNDLVSPIELRSLLERLNPECAGVYFSSCSFLNEYTANLLLQAPGEADTRLLTWAAGFTKEVDFIDGMAFDLLFLSSLLQSWRHQKRTGARDPDRERRFLDKAIHKIERDAKDLADRLGFKVYRRDGRSGKVSLRFPRPPAVPQQGDL